MAETDTDAIYFGLSFRSGGRHNFPLRLTVGRIAEIVIVPKSF